MVDKRHVALSPGSRRETSHWSTRRAQRAFAESEQRFMLTLCMQLLAPACVSPARTHRLPSCGTSAANAAVIQRATGERGQERSIATILIAGKLAHALKPRFVHPSNLAVLTPDPCP